jgi:hypothetical protein
MVERLEKILGINSSELLAFSKSFLDSGVDSIDSFLDRRPQFDEIGRLCVAFRLIEREDPQNLFRSVHNEDWYRRLWNNIIGDKRSLNEVEFEKYRLFSPSCKSPASRAGVSV